MRKIKRALALLLCLVMCLSLFPAEVFAEDGASTEEEECFDDCGHDHDHDHENEVGMSGSGKGQEPGASGGSSGEDGEGPEGQTQDPQTPPAGESTDPDESDPDEVDLTLTDGSPVLRLGAVAGATASCSHTYTYTYEVKNHTQHTKKGTCSKCGATTSELENHSFSNKQCTKCSCYEPIKTAGGYDVTAANGIKLYDQNNSSGTATTKAKGTYLYVSSVEVTSSGYYWGKVTKIGTQSANKYVCMKSSELAAHSHSYSYTYEVKDHSQHTKIGTCSKCGATTSSTENHSFSNKQCTKCSCYEPIKTTGWFEVTAANGIKLYDQNNSSGSSTTKAKGTCLYVSSVEVTSSGYYWGKVTKIGTQSANKYVCMKSSELTAHSHSYSYTYEVKDHSQHTKIGTCSKCGTTTSSTENHSFSNNQCTKCSCYAPITSSGWFEVTAANGIQLFDQNNSSGTSVTKAKGTFLYVSSVEVTSSGYYWGKVTKIGTQSANKYVCMKSSELTAHSHSYTYTYNANGHTQHTVTGTCSKCGNTTSSTENHSFSNNQCTKCGCYAPITSAGGYDVTAEGGIQLYDQNNSSGTPTVKAKGTYLYVSSVEVTGTGYYWGKVTKIGTQSVTKYVCMKSSELTAHSHSYSYSYSTKNNVQHTKSGTCSKCGATTSSVENHSFSNGTCSLCGAYEPYKTAGTYVANDAGGVTIYSGRVSTAGTEVETGIAKGTHLKVINVQLNPDSNNYWGEVEMVGNRAPRATAYVYMGKGTLAAHTHSFSDSYEQKSDTKHTVISSCSCGYQTSSLANHSFSGGSCTLCGKAEVEHSSSGYLSTRSSEPLRVSPYSDADSPRSVPAGTYLEISEVVVNPHGNYWGQIRRIDNETISTSLYTYLGNLRPHSHTLTTTYSSVNNLKHDKKAVCSGCKYVSTERLDHSFSNGKCSVCGGWQAYSADGDYIVINKDGAPLYKQRLSEGSSSQTLARNTFVQVAEVELNSAGFYWGRVVKIGSNAPSQTLYIYMGSGNVEPHVHSFTVSGTRKSDTQHNVVSTCSCGYQTTSVADHDFSGGKCTLCGSAEVAHAPGSYLSTRKPESLYVDIYSDSDSPRSVPAGTYLEISQVIANPHGNYWGKVSRIDNEAVTATLYVYMGKLQPHSHTLTTTYSSVNNLKHDKITSCSGCKFSEKERLDHSWSGSKCSVCGGWKAYETGGDYLVINKDGGALYAKRLSEGTPSRTLAKGTFIQVAEVELNSAGFYWGRVVKIGSNAPSQTLYIYMGSGNVEPHVHSFTVSGTRKSDTQHNVVSTCSCGYQTTSVADHDFSGGKCTLCGSAEVAHAPGGYLSTRNPESLYVDIYSDSDSPRSVPAGTYLEISQVIANPHGNYWGKVSRIDNEAVTATLYVYMGKLQPHSHTLTTTYSSVNNLKHDKITSCPGCKFSEKERLDHSWSGSKCSVCGGWKAYETGGDYLVINSSGGALYERRLSEGTPVKTLPAGSYVKVSDVQHNDAGYFWGKVDRYDNTVPSQTLYIYMGSGNIEPHTHTLTTEYDSSSDRFHMEKSVCSECSYQENAVKCSHSFENSSCKKCGHPEVPSTPGDYIVFRSSEPLRVAPSKNAQAPGHAEKGSFLHVFEVEPNSFDNYWGKVEWTDGNSSRILYVYMGNLTPHEHAIVTSYTNRNNLEHRKIETCSCGYSKTTIESHRFANGKCTDCGGWQAHTSDGGYVVVNDSGAPLYKQRLSEGTPTRTLPKGCYVQVAEVEHNDAGYYWGRVVKYGNETPMQTLYIYMGSGNVTPHTHSFATTYRSKSDTQHTKTPQCCSVCGFTNADSTLEDHSFSGGKCTKCGKEDFTHTNGLYITVRSVETLRLQPLDASDHAESVPAGTCLEISDIQPNQYGNYWGVVKKIGHDEPAVNPTYAYIGNLKPHAHSMSKTYHYVNNQVHEVTDGCSGCNLGTTTRENHSYNENGVCTKCAAQGAYEEAGGYLTVKDGGVPVYSRNITSGDNSRVLAVLEKGTYIEVEKPQLNSAGYYWGRVTRIGNKQITDSEYVYMGRTALTTHTHSFATVYSKPSDTEHTKTPQCCTVCGFTNSPSTKEQHSFSGGKCSFCGKDDVPKTGGTYITTRDPEVLRLNCLSDSTAAEKLSPGTCLEVKLPTLNQYGNYWAEVISINGAAPAKSPTYVYMGYLKPHQHHETVTIESVNNLQHQRVWTCSGCSKTITQREDHSFNNERVCAVCGAVEVYKSPGSYKVISAEGAPVYSQRLSSGPSKKLKTLPVNTYIEVTEVNANSAGYYWGKVVRIGSYAEKETMFIYMGRSQIEPHAAGNHVFEITSAKSVNNKQHEITKVCTICNYATVERLDHHYSSDGSECSCELCGAQSPWQTDQAYLTLKDGVELYSKRLSSGSSKKLKTVPAGTCLEVKDIQANSAGYFWGQVTRIGNTVVKNPAMYVYMGRSNFAPHTHSFTEKAVSASDTQHSFGPVCDECGYKLYSRKEGHHFVDGVCSACGFEDFVHSKGSYLTVNPTESFKSDMLSTASEVKKVPAGTFIQISSVSVNKYGNYWGKVSRIDNAKVTKDMFAYLGNLEWHPAHSMEPFYQSKSDLKHSVGEKCSQCSYTVITGTQVHDYLNGTCIHCGNVQQLAAAGNYVTLRETEPLREKASESAKALKKVPAGSRLYISKITANNYDNYWGKVDSVDGVAVKEMYVYMGHVQRHEAHDFQPYAVRKSDTQHTVGEKCSGCNLTRNTEVRGHRFADDGICEDCGCAEVAHDRGVYLVEKAGNLKLDRFEDAGNVQFVAAGTPLEVSEITTNKYGNYWGKVTQVGTAKPKKTNAYVYMGNLTPHTHEFTTSYTVVDQDYHNVVQTCSGCSYKVQTKAAHISENGTCKNCGADMPLSLSKGDYETVAPVTLYQDARLTKPAGVTVAAGYLIRIIDKVQRNKDGVYVGKVAQYGNAPSGKDVLYVRMSDSIKLHVKHEDTEVEMRTCDKYHYDAHVCKIVGCAKTFKDNLIEHSFSDGACTVCGHPEVPTSKGVYRVRSGGTLTLYAKPVSSSTSNGSAKGGSIIVVEQPSLNYETGNYWAKVVWANGKKLSSTSYVYMGSLVPYSRPSSVKITATSKTHHYLRDGDELFMEEHIWRGGFCDICGVSQGTPTAGLYLVKAKSVKAYTRKSNNNAVEFSYSTRSYPSGSRLNIEAVVTASNGVCYGKVSKCNGKAEIGAVYVRLDDLTFHGKHAEGSEFFVNLNDKQHSHDVNCPDCGVNAKTKENHAYDETGVCVQCGALKPADELGKWYVAKKAITVYKTDAESSQIIKTLPAGTILKIGSASWSKANSRMGSTIVVMSDGATSVQSGHIRMSAAAFSPHEHSWTEEVIAERREIDHISERRCTVCGLVERTNASHVYRAGSCTVCGTAERNHFIGEYTVKEQTAVLYKDIAGKTTYMVLKEGDYVNVTKIEPDTGSGLYRGLVVRIGNKDLKEPIYVTMSSLAQHKHNFQRVLFSTKDTYHLYKSTCVSCGYTELEPESHTYGRGGVCTVCGSAKQNDTAGLYVADANLTLFRSPSASASKVSKNSAVKKGTHLYIDKVKLEENVITTEDDQSYWGDAYWGHVRFAGKASSFGGVQEAWVRMGSLSSVDEKDFATYKSKSSVSHSVTFHCDDCGLNGTITQKHRSDSSGTCVDCGCSAMAGGTLYTKADNCRYYRIPKGKDGGVIFSLSSPAGTIPQAGTPVQVAGDVIEELGTVYCKILVGNVPVTDWQPEWKELWVCRDELTDHIHIAAGTYSKIDEQYHQLTLQDPSGSAVCKICGYEIPASMTEKQEHIFEEGQNSCKACGMAKVPQEAGKYYFREDGFSYKGIVFDKYFPSQYAMPGANYKKGAKIEVVSVNFLDGVYWGKVKNTDEFVVMSTLSTEPVEKESVGRTLSDQEIIDWCIGFRGYTSLYTYNYAPTMLGTISEADLLLMAFNNRASGAVDQIATWISQACGDTLARKYYKMQVLSLFTSLEEEAKYSVSIPLKNEVKNTLKAYKLDNQAALQNEKLPENEKDAIKSLNKKIGIFSDLIGYGEDGLNLAAFLTMDLARMKGIVKAARAVQAQVKDDPDLYNAFDEVISEYELAYVGAAQVIADEGLKQLKKYGVKSADDLIKKVVGFDNFTKAIGWSDFSLVYSTVNFALDMVNELTGGAKLSKSSMKFMSQISIVNAASSAYEAAVNRIRNGDHSPAAVSALRMQFELYKASVIELYETMLSMACNHILDINEDSDLKNYLQCELDKLHSMYLANSYNDYPVGISFEDFKMAH